jgi:hypothetical protein
MGRLQKWSETLRSAPIIGGFELARTGNPSKLSLNYMWALRVH